MKMLTFLDFIFTDIYSVDKCYNQKYFNFARTIKLSQANNFQLQWKTVDVALTF